MVRYFIQKGWFVLMFFASLASQRAYSQVGYPTAKEELRIGLVLPLSLPTSLDGDFKINQSMAEFCTAAKLAEGDLQALGIPLRLFFYDTHRNLDTLNRLTQGEDFKQLNMLIGPIYARETEALAKFAAKHQVPMVNPLTNQATHMVADNIYVYLAEPSINDMALAALNFRTPSGAKKVACIYGTTPQDSLLASAFASHAKDAGCTMALFKKVAKNSAANLPKFITEAALDSNSVLFVPNNEPLVRAQLLSALEITRNPTLTITYGSWIEETDTPIERFERLRMRFLYPDYAGYGMPQAEKIRTRIQAVYGLPATEIGLKGYDLVYTLGKALAQAKPEARSTFLKDYSPLRSDLFSGYDYTQGQTNARVPIYRILDGKLELE